MGDWTAEAQLAIDLCKEWAQNVKACLPFDIYLFGSAIYKGGEQFDRHSSDLDIVVVFSPELSATERVDQLVMLKTHKASLELNMIPTLSRDSCAEPGVSIVPITPFELHANIHKSGARHFFNKNFFLNLQSEVESLGLPGAATISVPDESRYALEYVQKIRNVYLNKTANLSGGLAPFAGLDPMPKALLRFAAQLNPDAIEGEWYDTRQGLELMYDTLRKRRMEESRIQQLFDCVSVRRGGRGHRQALSDINQLLLGEMLHDLATVVQTEDVVLWELRVSGASFTAADELRLRQALAQLMPDATVIDVRQGSLIFRIQSSRSRFDTMRRLEEMDVLAKFLDVENAELLLIEGGSAAEDVGFRAQDREQKLFEFLLRWRPQGRGRELEDELEAWLKTAASDSDFLKGARIVREPHINHDGVISRPDLGVLWPTLGGWGELVAVEIIQLGNTSMFLQKLERMLEMPYKTLLVVVGNIDRLNSIQEDIHRLSRLSGRVRVVRVPI